MLNSTRYAASIAARERMVALILNRPACTDGIPPLTAKHLREQAILFRRGTHRLMASVFKQAAQRLERTAHA